MPPARALARAASMLASALVTALTLDGYAALIQHLLGVAYDWRLELGMVGGQILFQLPFVYGQSRERKLDYFALLLRISLTGAGLLWPLLLVNRLRPLPDGANVAAFFVVVLVMFCLHKLEIERRRLPWYLSYTWVLYRCLLLPFLL